MPTFLEAAGVVKPLTVKWDGLSLLDLLKSAGHEKRKHHHHSHSGGHSHSAHSHSSSSNSAAAQHVTAYPNRLLSDVSNETRINASDVVHNVTTVVLHEGSIDSNTTSPLVGVPLLSKLGEDKLRNRVFLWHKDTDPAESHGPTYQSGGYFDDVKIITTERRGCLYQVYDLRHDPYENRNLVVGMQGKFISSFNHYPCPVRYDTYQNVHEIENLIDKVSARAHCTESQGATGNIELCMKKYHLSIVTKIQVIIIAVIVVLF